MQDSRSQSRHDESVVRSMIKREDDLTDQRIIWMAAFNGLLFAALGFAWGKPGARFLTLVFSSLGLLSSLLSGIALVFAADSLRRLMLWWEANRPEDYNGPGVMGANPRAGKKLYGFYFTPWILLAVVFAGGWVAILWFAAKYVR